MSLIAVGLFFILVSVNYDFLSADAGAYFTINVIPDFIGYIFIVLSLEKQKDMNRWFKECHTFATGMLFVTFLIFLSQIEFFFAGMLEYGDMQWLGIVLTLLSKLFTSAEFIIKALNMLFAFFFCYAFGTEFQSREMTFSTVLMYIFSVIFIGFIIVFGVYQFIRFPLNPTYIEIPVSVLFIAVAYLTGRRLKEFGD